MSETYQDQSIGREFTEVLFLTFNFIFSFRTVYRSFILVEVFV